MIKNLIEKIKSRGYWRINFQPLVDQRKFKTLVECKNIVEFNSVQTRGWDFPCVPRKKEDYMDLIPCENYYLGWIDWAHHIEFWHMYQSGQFLLYRSLCEDWGMVKNIEPMFFTMNQGDPLISNSFPQKIETTKAYEMAIDVRSRFHVYSQVIRFALSKVIDDGFTKKKETPLDKHGDVQIVEFPPESNFCTR